VLTAGQVHTVIVDSMHERKTEMARLSSGFVILPGGYGTWEEVCVVPIHVVHALTTAAAHGGRDLEPARHPHEA
jgi:hypothetical protein